MCVRRGEESVVIIRLYVCMCISFSSREGQHGCSATTYLVVVPALCEGSHCFTVCSFTHDSGFPQQSTLLTLFRTPPPPVLGTRVSQEHTRCFHYHAHEADSSERWLFYHHRHPYTLPLWPNLSFSLSPLHRPTQCLSIKSLHQPSHTL